MPSRVFVRDGVGVLEITRTNGEVVEALIDAEDVPDVGAVNWYTKRVHHQRYVERKCGYYKKRKTVLLHRFIMDADARGFECVDHINGNGLDNRKRNLRGVTVGENLQNLTRLQVRNTSGYRGVTHRPHGWEAYCSADGRKYYLGSFGTAKEAASAASRGRAELLPGSIEALVLLPLADHHLQVPVGGVRIGPESYIGAGVA